MIRPFYSAFALLLLVPETAWGQGLFEWPLRAAVQPEAVLVGAGAVFWNPGAVVREAGSSQEVLLLHVDGPDVTGVGGVAAAGVFDLPAGLRGGIGVSHLGISDIPRTSTSPSPEPGRIDVSEESAVLTLALAPGPRTGVGVGFRFQRGAAGGDSRLWNQAEIGVFHRWALPLSPRVGLVVRRSNRGWQGLLGTELLLASWASSRVPVRMGYGTQVGNGFDATEHRLSLRASWMDLFHLGLGLAHQGSENGWSPLWRLGADLGRYSLSVLRESLFNDFGAVHSFQASVRFPGPRIP